jgi:hypothetical protein
MLGIMINKKLMHCRVRNESETGMCKKNSVKQAFKLNSHMNTHNMVSTSNGNLHIMIEKELYLAGVCVLGGIYCNGLVSPCIFGITGTAQSRLNLTGNSVQSLLDKHS